MVAVATFVLQIALSTLRWGLILTFITGTKPPYYSLFGIYYASTFFSQILPLWVVILCVCSIAK